MSSYLQLKKRAFMSIVNGVKGFVRTVSGVPPISLEDCVDSDSLIDWKLYGNSFQDGTPSPENSIPVVSVGEYDSVTGKYKIPVTVRGKNLFDKDNANVFGGYISGNSLIAYSTTLGNNRATCIECKPNTTYTISRQVLSKRFVVASGIYAPAKDITFTKSISNYDTLNIQITTDSEDAYLYVWFYNGDVDTEFTYDEIINGLQIQEGTTATDYEPYHAPIQTNIYLDEPLRSQYQQTESKWYCDEINFKTNILIRNLSEKTVVGAANEKWNYSKETDEKIYFYMNGLLNNCSFGEDSVMCDRFVASYSYATNIISTAEGISVAYSTNNIYLSIFKSRLTDAGLTVDLDGFKTWLSQNPVTITYILKEPIEETISLPKLPTIKGTTIYEIGTSLNASNMEATYYSTVKGE